MGPAVAPAGMAAVPVGGGSSAPGHTDGATAVQNSPSTSRTTPLPGQNSPCSPKMAQFDAFCPRRANFLPLSPPTSHAGRTFSRARHDNIATLKPTTPLLTPNRGPLKPASPLHPKNAPKTPISHPQRRHRFQPHTDTSKQRRRRFQTTDPAGLQGQAAVPVGDCGARPDNEPTPRTTRRHTRHRRCGGRRRDGRPGCGARGRWRGLAGLRDDAPSHTSAHQVPLVWRAPEGPEGAGGHGRARAGFEIDHSEPQARVWRSRGRPGPPAPGTPAEPQATPSMTRAAAHGHTKQPGPTTHHAAPGTPAAQHAT